MRVGVLQRVLSRLLWFAVVALLVPLAMADGPSCYTVARPSSHLATNAWLIERFGLAAVRLSEIAGGSYRVEVRPGPPRA